MYTVTIWWNFIRHLMIRELFQGVKLMHELLFRIYPSDFNKEVFSFHEVGIEEFHYIQRCLHFRFE